MLNAILAVAALAMPSENYTSWISPEISDMIVDYLIEDREYRHLDFNGDGKMNIADAVGVAKRYADNVAYGNSITLDIETIYDIGWENYSDDQERQDFINNSLMYWEICNVNDEPCREYELTVSEISEAEIYYEFEDYSDSVRVRLNPYEETIQVIS